MNDESISVNGSARRPSGAASSDSPSGASQPSSAPAETSTRPRGRKLGSASISKRERAALMTPEIVRMQREQRQLVRDGEESVARICGKAWLRAMKEDKELASILTLVLRSAPMPQQDRAEVAHLLSPNSRV